MDLSRRADLPELMDAPGLDVADYERCLADLAAVNRVTFTHWPVLRFLARATRHLPRGAAVSVLDLAFGQGDLLRAIAKWGAKRGFRMVLSGIDLNPRSAAAARAATVPADAIDYHTGDVFGFTPRERPDFIVTSQFTHHLGDAEIVRLLRWMDETASVGWLIVDLHRHALPFYGFRVLCRVMGWHRIVQHDGTVSIARGFRAADWRRYLAEAGVTAEVAWRPLFRHAISKRK